MPSQRSGSSTCRGKRKSGARLSSALCIAIAASMTGCATSSTPRCEGAPSLPSHSPSPLVVASCPEELPTMADTTMGSAVQALMDAAETYHMCRRAALAGAQ